MYEMQVWLGGSGRRTIFFISLSGPDQDLVLFWLLLAFFCAALDFISCWGLAAMFEVVCVVRGVRLGYKWGLVLPSFERTTNRQCGTDRGRSTSTVLCEGDYGDDLLLRWACDWLTVARILLHEYGAGYTRGDGREGFQSVGCWWEGLATWFWGMVVEMPSAMVYGSWNQLSQRASQLPGLKFIHQRVSPSFYVFGDCWSRTCRKGRSHDLLVYK